MRMLIIDNFDSFTYNLVQLFAAQGVDVVVRRNTASMDELRALAPDLLCVSPGPGTPRDSGVSFDAVAHWHTRIPVFGVCLGMQVINELHGGRTVHAPVPVHGKAHAVRHDGSGVFDGLPSPFFAARYHSLAIERRGAALVENAWTADGVIMGIRHATLPLHAVQFHPESFLTEHGTRLAGNVLALGGRDRR
ncbi:MAG: aminodeoxychorismate/anthranilate synthase component II [Bacteroidota bacterium]|jgi:anthranilate synthase component 2|nr:aminodeoxychorismate/anthranilate synthase component II [Bacteroidota bacterium]